MRIFELLQEKTRLAVKPIHYLTCKIRGPKQNVIGVRYLPPTSAFLGLWICIIIHVYLWYFGSIFKVVRTSSKNLRFTSKPETLTLRQGCKALNNLKNSIPFVTIYELFAIMRLGRRPIRPHEIFAHVVCPSTVTWWWMKNSYRRGRAQDARA